jgi:selenoprotein W-related protein
LAAELRARFPASEVTLIPSGKGRFEVVADGAPVFEKSRLGRHAEPGEVARALEARGAR